MAMRTGVERVTAVLAWIAAALGSAVLWAGEAKETPKEQFEAFVKAPTKESFLKVFETVTSAKSYDPYSRELDAVQDLLKDDRNKEALEQIDKAMPNLLLSPRAHLFGAMAAKRLGDAQRADKEGDAHAACIRGIQLTGDGSPDHPYLVARVDDEYDLLRHLKKPIRKQSLRHRNEKAFDVMDCTDGSEVWFDITAVFGRLMKSLGK